MRTSATGTATMRHVGLVALEALLVAMIVWVATMALAGATQNGGIVGAAAAGDSSASLTVAGAELGGTAVFTAHPGDEGMWVHATCIQASSTVLSAWVRIDALHHATLPLVRSTRWSSGDATCVAEEGYFSTNGRWRVIVSTAFTLGG
jgi:hypothetical protein